LSSVTPVTHARAQAHHWARTYAIMYAIYVLVGLVVRFAGWMHDDALVYLQASRRVLDGSFDLYSILRTPFIAPPLGTTYAYSPLMAIIIAPFVAVADALSLGNVWAMKILGIPLLLIDVLAMEQLRRLARTYRPQVDERVLFGGIALTLFVTSFWLVTAYKSHIEGMVLLFLLLALRLLRGNLLLSGICAGLALSAKHMTVLPCLIPIGLALLAARPTDDHLPLIRRLREALVWGGAALSVFAVFMLPAVLSNPHAVYYAFVTQGTRIVTLGPGLPTMIDRLLQGSLSQADYLPVRENLLTYSNMVMIIATILVPSIVILWARGRGRPIGLSDTRLIGLVAFGGISYVIFAKWVSDSYYQMPLALVFLWDVLRVTPNSGARQSAINSFPWVGIGGALAFRAVTQFGSTTYSESGKYIAAQAMDGILLLLFITLAALILRWVLSYTPTPAPHDPQPLHHQGPGREALTTSAPDVP